MKTISLYNHPFTFFNPLVETFLFEPLIDFYNPVSENVSHTPFKYEWNYNLPEIRKKDLRIDVQNGILSIRGQRQNSGWFSKKNKEILHFEKQICLSKDMNIDRIEAKYRKGVLSIAIPKKEELINYREIKVTGDDILESTAHEDKGTLWSNLKTKIRKTFSSAA